MADIFRTSGTNIVGQIMCILFIVYGGVWILLISLSIPDIISIAIGTPFFLLGFLWLIRNSPTSRLVFGILGAIGTFFAAISWSNVLWVEASTIMTLFSIVLLALSLGIICSVTCSWPDYEEYGT